jgi:hypothetical protein
MFTLLTASPTVSPLRASIFGGQFARKPAQSIALDANNRREEEQLGLEVLRVLEQTHPAATLSVLEGQLNEATKRIIGDNGVRRFNEFKRYHKGWDFGRGERLSATSVRIFNWFLGKMPDLAAYEPSLFLTHQGNLQLGWETDQGAIEIEFFSHKLEFYIEPLNLEDAVALKNSNSLISRLRSILS